MKIIPLLFSLFLVVVSCSKNDEPSPGPGPTPPPNEKALAPEKTYIGVLLTATDIGGFKSITDNSGITTITAILGEKTFTFRNDKPLRVGESLNLTNENNSVEISVNNFGIEPKFTFTLTDYTDIELDFYESNSVRAYSGTQTYKENEVLEESFLGTILLDNQNKEWKGIDRVTFVKDPLAGYEAGDYLDSNGTYTETETEIVLKAGTISFTLKKEEEGNKLILDQNTGSGVVTEGTYTKLNL